MGESHGYLDHQFANPNMAFTDAKSQLQRADNTDFTFTNSKPLAELFPLVTISESTQEDEWLSGRG